MSEKEIVAKLSEMIEDARDTSRAIAVGSDWKDERRVTICPGCGAPTLGARCSACERKANKNGDVT